MTTTAKVAIGAAVVIGGVIAYKLMTAPDPRVRDAAASTKTPDTSSIGGFLALATAGFNYFAKQNPAPPAVTSSKWDSSPDIGLPLLPGQGAYEDSTRNDYLLS